MLSLSDLSFLAVPLPEDLQRLKAFGDFEGLERAIASRLCRELPLALQKRLLLEREIIRLLPRSYPYSEEEALARCRTAFEGFTPQELWALREEGAVDWLYCQGEPRYKDDFVETLVKSRPSYAARYADAQQVRARQVYFQALEDAIGEMRREGCARRRIRVRITAQVREEAAKPGETIRVHLPLPVGGAQVERVRMLSMRPACGVVGAQDSPLRTVFFEKPYAPGDVFSLEYEYDIVQRYVEPRVEQVLSEQPDLYLQEQPPHIAFTPFIRSLAQQIVGEETNPLSKARRIYDYLTQKVTYSYVRPYMTYTNLPEAMLLSGKGDCGLYALSFIVLCRCAGVAARWQSGMAAGPFSVSSHDWAQFYAAPYGWLFADCSFGGAAWREGALERWNFYFGNLDPFRLPAASTFQQPLRPAMRFLRNDPYDNQTGDAEFESGRVEAEDWLVERELLSIETLAAP